MGDMRKPDQNECVLAIPRSCDMAAEFIIYLLMALFRWYVVFLVTSTIDWVVLKAQDPCTDAIQTEVSYCDPIAIFIPIKTLENPSAYVALVFLMLVPMSVCFKIAWTMDRCYHFSNDAL